MLWIRLRKEPGILRFGKELIMFIRDFFSYHSLQVQLGFKNINSIISFYRERLFLICCILNFVSASFSTQPRPLFVLLQFETGSYKNTLELGNEVSLSETKLNNVNSNVTRVFSFVKKANILLCSSLMSKF